MDPEVHPFVGAADADDGRERRSLPAQREPDAVQVADVGPVGQLGHGADVPRAALGLGRQGVPLHQHRRGHRLGLDLVGGGLRLFFGLGPSLARTPGDPGAGAEDQECQDGECGASG